MPRVVSLQTRNFSLCEIKIKNSTKRFFTGLHIIFSLDFGYIHFQSRRVNILIKFLTYIQCLVIFGVTPIYFIEHMYDPYTAYWIVTISVQYFLNSVLMLLYGHECSFYKLEETLMHVDLRLSAKSDSYGVDKKIIYAFVGCGLYQAILNMIFCFDNENECVTTIHGGVINALQYLSFDLILITFSFSFYSLNCRLKALNTLAQNTDHVLFCIELYKVMADAIEKPKKYYDYLYTFAILMKTSDLILTIYVGILTAAQFGMEVTHHQVVRHLYTVHIFTLICAPAVCAGVVTSTVEKLKLILQDRLLLETDEGYEEHIQLFIDYVNARPMKFTMFKIISLDYRLPILILNICITYQIAIVQFTNLY